ncbi:cytochrome c oxidase subunit II [Fodinisporobacter ferrooxydans]|uniref:Cytochrome aa3 subunit 2 n=1 Tax=Fodinisporobacter ferrooxydans TaxID=2901836 RepID=A0ABY4CNL6_9BACL|nr:cytochrome c oxidase subunit II [Alicyclobacillaceae bacterium MYW30-H2]
MYMPRSEKVWITIGGVVLAAFFATVAIDAFVMGATPPSDPKMIDPAKVSTTPPFDKPGLVQVGPKEYDANMTAFTFGFGPNVLNVPVGAKVNFHVTSKDVVHGFEIPGTDVNMMIDPGFVNSASHTFDKPGKYLILCNEYCGAGHQLMMATIIVGGDAK